MQTPTPRPARGAGFSLIEVVVATAIVSVGLAGLALLLLASVQGTAAARHRTVATLHAESLGEAVTLTPDAAAPGAEPAGEAVDACAGPGECTALAFRDAMRSDWTVALETDLPSPAASLCTAADAFACGELAPGIRLDWFEPLEPGDREALVLRWGSP